MPTNNKKKVIKNYKDFMNFKINVNDFNNDYKATMKGGCGCGYKLKKGGLLANNFMDMQTFLNVNLPKLKGGYLDLEVNVNQSTKADDDGFNLFRDWLSPQATSLKTNSLLYSDLSQKSFSYPSMEVNMQRTLV